MSISAPSPATTAAERDLGVVVVTGGASGLGRAVARALGEGGGTPVVLDRQPAEDGLDAETVDLGDPRAAEAAVHRAIDRHGRLDAVVTAAGTDAGGALEDVDGEAWDTVVRVNLLGTAAVVRAALPALRRGRGRVVTIASTLGIRALPDATAYCASKFGVLGFTRALAAETAGEVGVTCLLPGGMATAFFDGRPEQYRPGPDADLAPPEQIAAAVLFALRRPPGVEVRELLVCPSGETSWP